MISFSSTYAQTHLWSKSFGDASVTQEARSVAVDSSSNVLVTGFFDGTVDFGGGPLTSAGGLDIFLAKFDPWGYLLWSKRFGDLDGQQASLVTADIYGNVLLAGSLNGTMDFGGGSLTSIGLNDIFLAKFDDQGNHLWSKRFGGPNDQMPLSITVDGGSNVLITGFFRLTVDFDGHVLTSAGLDDIFLAKFDSSGNYLWSKSFGDTDDRQRGQCVTVDSSDNPVVIGEFRGIVDFGGGSLTSAGLSDLFLAKFDSSGNHLWSKSFGDAVNQGAYDWVGVDGSDNIVTTGTFQGTVDFGGGPLTSGGVNVDIFLAKFDSSGNHLWSQRFGDATYGQYSYSVVVDGENNAFIAGEMSGTVDFGGGLLTSAGSDIYIAKFDSLGNHQWSKRFGDSDVQYAQSIAVDKLGRPTIAGLFQSTVDFGGGTLTSAGGRDIFVAKFSATTTGINPSLLVRELTTTSYPNPFNPGVTISYVLPQAAHVQLEVYDVGGKKVANLVDRSEVKGEHKVRWDAVGFATGVYFYRVSADEQSVTKKIVLLK